MSDIGINLAGLLALVIFLVAAAALGLAALICLIVAAIKASNAGQPARKQRAFAYFIVALIMLVVNAIAFGILYWLVDHNTHETNNYLDIGATFVWLPLQPIVWIASGYAINRKKKL